MNESTADSHGPLYISEEYNFFLPNCDSLTATLKSGGLPVLKRRQRFSTSEVSFDLPINGISDGLTKVSNTKPPTPHCVSKFQYSPPPKYKQREDSILSQVISIENYDPSSDIMFDDNYTLQALEIANILPEELYYSTYSHLAIEERKKQRQIISQKVQKVRQIRFELINNDQRIFKQSSTVDLQQSGVSKYKGRANIRSNAARAARNIGMLGCYERRMNMRKTPRSPKIKAAFINPQTDEGAKALCMHSEANMCARLPLDTYFDLKRISSTTKKVARIIPESPSEFHVKNIIF